MSIPKKEFSGAVKVSSSESQDYFVLLSSSKPIPPITASFVTKQKVEGDENEITRKLVGEGRLKKNGPLIARFVEREEKFMAGCGHNLDQPYLVLETAEGESDLRCCGP